MSGAQENGGDMQDRDDKTIAAEFSLGLLEGEELLAARGRLISDAEFAWRKEWWDDWFVPLSDDVAGMEPGQHVWQSIESRVRSARGSTQAEDELAVDNSAVMQLDEARQSVRRWQWTAAVTSAAAAVAIALFVSAPGADPAQPGGDPAPAMAANNTAPLMASMPVADTQLRLGVTFLPEQGELLVSAGGFTADGVHDHELWLVPSDGSELQSLGLVAAGEERRVDLSEAITRNISDGVKLVLTREPIGGKPDGSEAGPVVAEGSLSAV